MNLKQLQDAYLDYDTKRGNYYALQAIDPKTDCQYRLIYLISDSDLDCNPSTAIDWSSPNEILSYGPVRFFDLKVNFND